MRQTRGRGAATTAAAVLTPRVVIVGLIAAVMLLAVALAAREAGPIPIEDRSLLSETDSTVAPAPVQTTSPTQQTRTSEGFLSKASMWYVIASLTALVLLFALVIRALIARDDDEEDEETKAPPPHGGPSSAAGSTDRLRRAAQQAEESVRAAAPGDVGSAVIAAWLQLERAATDVGSARRPSATPTEFTVGLLNRHRADSQAMSVLLDLYQQARFGHIPLPERAADEAIAALRTIAIGLGAKQTGTGAR